MKPSILTPFYPLEKIMSKPNLFDEGLELAAASTPKNHEYLGDGVYASYSNNYVELRLGSHENEPLIYLDHLTMQALISFARRQGP